MLLGATAGMDLKIAGGDGHWSAIGRIARIGTHQHQGCAGGAIEYVQVQYVLSLAGLAIIDDGVALKQTAVAGKNCRQPVCLRPQSP